MRLTLRKPWKTKTKNYETERETRLNSAKKESLEYLEGLKSLEFLECEEFSMDSQ